MCLYIYKDGQENETTIPSGLVVVVVIIMVDCFVRDRSGRQATRFPTFIQPSARRSKRPGKFPSFLYIQILPKTQQTNWITIKYIHFLCLWVGKKTISERMRLVGLCGWASFVPCKWDAAGWMELGSFFPTYQKKKKKKKVLFLFNFQAAFISQSSENRWLIYERTDGPAECPCICHLHLFTTSQKKKNPQLRRDIYKLRAISWIPTSSLLHPLLAENRKFYLLLLPQLQDLKLPTRNRLSTHQSISVVVPKHHPDGCVIAYKLGIGNAKKIKMTQLWYIYSTWLKVSIYP